MLPGNYQGQEENAWCSYGMISEFGNKFCFLNLSVIPLDVPALCSLLSRNFTPQVIMLNTIYSIKVFNKWPPKVCGWTPTCSKGKRDWTTLVQLRPVSLNHLQCLPAVLKIRKGYQGQSEKKTPKIWTSSPLFKAFESCCGTCHVPRLNGISLSLQASFPGNLHLVMVLRPTGFFQRTFTDIGFRFSQEDFLLKLPVRACGDVVPVRDRSAARAPRVGEWQRPTRQAPVWRVTGVSLPEMPFFHQISLHQISPVAFFSSLVHSLLPTERVCGSGWWASQPVLIPHIGCLLLWRLKPCSAIYLMSEKSKDMSSEAFAMNSTHNHHFHLSVNFIPTSCWYLFLK